MPGSAGSGSPNGERFLKASTSEAVDSSATAVVASSAAGSSSTWERLGLRSYLVDRRAAGSTASSRLLVRAESDPDRRSRPPRRRPLAPEADFALVERDLLSLRRVVHRASTRGRRDRVAQTTSAIHQGTGLPPAGERRVTLEGNLGPEDAGRRRIGRGGEADWVLRPVADTEAILRRRAIANRGRRISARKTGWRVLEGSNAVDAFGPAG